MTISRADFAATVWSYSAGIAVTVYGLDVVLMPMNVLTPASSTIPTPGMFSPVPLSIWSAPTSPPGPTRSRPNDWALSRSPTPGRASRG